MTKNLEVITGDAPSAPTSNTLQILLILLKHRVINLSPSLYLQHYSPLQTTFSHHPVHCSSGPCDLLSSVPAFLKYLHPVRGMIFFKMKSDNAHPLPKKCSTFHIEYYPSYKNSWRPSLRSRISFWNEDKPGKETLNEGGYVGITAEVEAEVMVKAPVIPPSTEIPADNIWPHKTQKEQ